MSLRSVVYEKSKADVQFVYVRIKYIACLNVTKKIGFETIHIIWGQEKKRTVTRTDYWVISSRQLFSRQQRILMHFYLIAYISYFS